MQQFPCGLIVMSVSVPICSNLYPQHMWNIVTCNFTLLTAKSRTFRDFRLLSVSISKLCILDSMCLVEFAHTPLFLHIHVQQQIVLMFSFARPRSASLSLSDD